MRKVITFSCFAIVFALIGSVSADSLTGLPDVTIVDNVMVDLTFDGVTYVVAEGDLSLGVTTRWWLDNGVETLWAEGDPAPPGNGIGSTPKAGDVGSKADNFIFRIGNTNDISSIDGIEFQETIFPFRTKTIFVFERGGNDNGKVEPILPDGSLGTALTLTAGGDPYANTGVNVGGQNAFGYVLQTDQQVIGLRITAPGHDSFTISAPTPLNVVPISPAPDAEKVELDVTFQWTYSDEADVQVDSYTIYMDTNPDLVEEPNLPDQPMLIDGTGDAAGIVPTSGSDPSAAYSYSGLEMDSVYYWRIVADVLEPNAVTGIYNQPLTVYSSIWSFSTRTSAPVVDAGGSLITWLQDGEMSVVPQATVTDATGDLKSTQWSVIGNPPGSTVDISDPAAVTPTITVDAEGPYLLKLFADDLAGNTAEQLIEIMVYADSCQAAKNNPAGYTAPLYDFNDDCIQSLADLEVFLASWLTDNTLKDNILY